MARQSASSLAGNPISQPQLPVGTDDDDQPTHLANGTSREETVHESETSPSAYNVPAHPLPYDPSLLPNGRRSLASIGIQAFSLGFVLASCLIAAVLLVKNGKSIWRLPVFFACLSLFHFLEFWTTARFNMPAARASSFLLRNGKAYTFAHGLATTEIVVSTFLPSYQAFLVTRYSITVGAIIVIAGQLLRSTAMAEAGTNFNHTPAKIKKEGHVLVTTGVYAWLRHPSYCAFFWWALGTQVLVGNKISFLGYSLVLWNFFKRRIRAEETTLVAFFGQEYEEYRTRTVTGIPLV